MAKSRSSKLYAPEIEVALLGAILMAPERLPPDFSPDVFGKRANALVARAILELLKSGSSLTLPLLANQLQASGYLDEVGGTPYLESLRLQDTNPEHIQEYWTKLVTLHRYRLLAQRAKELEALANEGNPSALDVLREMQDLWSIGGPQSARAIAEAMDMYEAYLQGKRVVRLTTPWPGLDSVLYLSAGMLVVVAARPGMGKSAFALQLAEHMAANYGPVLYVSLEMSLYELGLRTLSRKSGIPLTRLREAEYRPLGASLQERIANAMEAVASLPIMVEDSVAKGTTIEVREQAKRIKAEYGLSAIVVDYIQLMVDAESRLSGNVVQATAAVSRELKLLARELDVPVIALSQLSRAVEQRNDKRPRLSDLRDSGAIEQDADAVVFLYRPGYYKEDGDNLTEVIVAKQRQGPLDTIPLIWVPPTLSFREPHGTAN